MRPTAVRQAEWVFLGAVALMLTTAAVMWRGISVVYGPLFSAGVTAFSIGLWLLLLLFATRRGRNWARWALVVLTGFGIVSLLQQIATGRIAFGALLLFRPAAKAWFAKPHTDWEEDA